MVAGALVAARYSRWTHTSHSHTRHACKWTHRMFSARTCPSMQKDTPSSCWTTSSRPPAAFTPRKNLEWRYDCENPINIVTIAQELWLWPGLTRSYRLICVFWLKTHTFTPSKAHIFSQTLSFLSFQGLGKYGVLFYNAFIIIIPTVLASAYTGDLRKVSEKMKCEETHMRISIKLIFFPCFQALTFEGWLSFTFIFYFLLSCVMGWVWLLMFIIHI